MTALAAEPRTASESTPPRRRRTRLMLAALAISLLVHGAVAAVLLWPAADPRDSAGEGAAVVVEIVGESPQPVALTPTTATPPTVEEAAPAETAIEPSAARPAIVAAPAPRTEPEPRVEQVVESVVEPVVETRRVDEIAAIEPAAGPPKESEPAKFEIVELEPEILTAAVAATTLPTPTPKPVPAAMLAEPAVEPVAAYPAVVISVPPVGSAATPVSGRPVDQPVAATASTTEGALLQLAVVESDAISAGTAPGTDRAPLFDLPELDNPWPDYPRLARRRSHEGEALLTVTVLADGAPAAVELRTSSGYALLDEAALDAVRRWRFLPALVAGRPVQAVVNVPVVFRLE